MPERNIGSISRRDCINYLPKAIAGVFIATESGLNPGISVDQIPQSRDEVPRNTGLDIKIIPGEQIPPDKLTMIAGAVNMVKERYPHALDSAGSIYVKYDWVYMPDGSQACGGVVAYNDKPTDVQISADHGDGAVLLHEFGHVFDIVYSEQYLRTKINRDLCQSLLAERAALLRDFVRYDTLGYGFLPKPNNEVVADLFALHFGLEHGCTNGVSWSSSYRREVDRYFSSLMQRM